MVDCIRAKNAFKVLKIEFPALLLEFISPIFILPEFLYIRKVKLGDGNSSRKGGKFNF